MNELDELKKIMKILRSENGCNWDKKQSFQSLKEFILEESYEVVEAVEEKNFENLKEELGDLLFNIFFFSEIASEQKLFQIEDVAKVINEKLIRRHPHVFQNPENLNADEVLVNWNKIKEEEKKSEPKKDSILDSIPKAFPALIRAEKIQSKAKSVGFDFENIDDVKKKVFEELEELFSEIKSGDKSKQEDELGDILFSVVNLSRFLKISPEIALKSSTKKFENRFKNLEKMVQSKDKKWDEYSLKELDELWDQVKKKD